MTGSPAALAAHSRREYRLVLISLLFVVLFRSAIFVFWERSHFDADQAISGLMAKHLAERRALPVFFYGQSYMLAVEAWMAAPVFAIAGASVTALKLPLLAINMVIAWLLLRGFVREVGLRPLVAAAPALFFALAAPGTSARFLEANGGNVEPLLYVLLIWVLRDRPAWCGFVAGIGFLQREFTIYGVAALLLIEAIQGRLFTREGTRRTLNMFRVAAEVWLVIFWLKYLSSGAGPGTTLDAVYMPRDNVTELLNRVCLDLQAAATGFLHIVTVHWPILFGIEKLPLSTFGVLTSVSQGAWWSGIILTAMACTAVAGIGVALICRTSERLSGFCAYLILAALFSIVGYAVGKCGVIEFNYTRYELLSVLGIAGLSAWFLRVADAPWLRRSWLALAGVWFVVAAAPYTRLYREYLLHPPEDIRRHIIHALEARGDRFARADYWIAYPLTFLSNERIIVGSTDFVRILEYQELVDAQPQGVIRISRERCDGGRQIVPRVYLCEQ
jgi:hypothetical protein